MYLVAFHMIPYPKLSHTHTHTHTNTHTHTHTHTRTHAHAHTITHHHPHITDLSLVEGYTVSLISGQINCGPTLTVVIDNKVSFFAHTYATA